MPTSRPDTDLRRADAAIALAQSVRQAHRKRTKVDDLTRLADLTLALDKIKAAMAPIKSAQGRFPYEPQTEVAEKYRQEIRDTSQALQRERRKLWKMLPREENAFAKGTT